MSETKGDAVVLTDTDGYYYVLPREVIEVSRIEKAAHDRVDQLLASGASGGSERFSFRGAITLPADSEWTHFTPNVAWPNVAARPHPNQMVMMDKPVIRAAGAE
ncbi:hypothetical protein ACFY8W_01985 [Streptomyces sp. NPDC012637]|uniref:hypothetical protein n=1 Tax=Streptomyces sp. NPDC012637 TaxID=3364842 RepID=UPI0036ECEEB2